MNKGKRNEALSPFVEECGLVFEEFGLPRTSGRIWGWLIVCDPPEQTAKQLARALRVSKGSISTNTRLLERVGMLERVGIPGSRESQHRLVPHAWESVLKHRIAGTHRMVGLAERGMELLEGGSAERTRRLREKLEFYTFFARELESLLERWQDHRRAMGFGD